MLVYRELTSNVPRIVSVSISFSFSILHKKSLVSSTYVFVSFTIGFKKCKNSIMDDVSALRLSAGLRLRSATEGHRRDQLRGEYEVEYQQEGGPDPSAGTEGTHEGRARPEC